jgi:ribose transport system ATP-binding protein
MSADAAVILRLSGVRKRFGGVVALDGVDFELRAGEIHALLGENGAGKSTLIKTLAGIHQPDAGIINFDGKRVVIRDVMTADQLGIRVIHQELSLAPNLSVAENIFLGREPRRFRLLDRARMFREAERLRNDLGLKEIGAVTTRVSELSVAKQQLVEIARALSVRARALVLDEPTASLSAAEAERLFEILRQLRSQDVGIIYISHRLEEIQRLAGRITVLRDGKSIGTQSAAKISQAELIQWMVGRELSEHYPRPPWEPGDVALSVRSLKNSRVNDVSFDLHYGEVLGFAGLVGSGRTELAQTLFGILPLESGEILVDGKRVTLRQPSEALNAGIVLVPEDRKRQGLIMTDSIGFNLALPQTRGGYVSSGRQAEIFQRDTRDFAIKATGPTQPVVNLSGGNQQKVVVAKWLERRPKILILDEPTRGVDVGAREEMFGIIRSAIEQRMAVLLISSDLPEVMNLSHRLALYRNGRIVQETRSHEIIAEEIMSVLTRN